MRKLLLILLAAVCAAGAVASVVMLVMAARFSEYGRFLFYFTVAIVCIEMGVIAVMKLKNTTNPDS